MLGSLELPIRKGRFYTVAGGPYLHRPAGYKGVNLAAEIKAPCDIRLAIPDFSVPDIKQLDTALIAAVEAVLSGAPVYAGCMGGRGRTGLFLAILAKAWGIADPVEYVRVNYFPHAVETKEQYNFVLDYEAPGAVKAMLARAYWRSWLTWKPFGRRSLTQAPVPVTAQGAVTNV